jgi:hypothetical protein
MPDSSKAPIPRNLNREAEFENLLRVLGKHQKE